MRRLSVLIFLGVLLLSGCVKRQYNWGYYSHTLYKYKKAQNEKTYAKHRSSVEKIIKKYEAKEKRVPPGVYCEFGYYLMLDGETELGMQYFDKEVAAYPESETFINTLKSQIVPTEEETDE